MKVAHQLSAHDGESLDYVQCRAEIAGYIRAHPADFLPFLAADGISDVGAYCETVEHSAEWGGQREITAIAHARRRTVVVFSADAPPLRTGDEYAAKFAQTAEQQAEIDAAVGVRAVSERATRCRRRMWWKRRACPQPRPLSLASLPPPPPSSSSSSSSSRASCCS